MICWYRRLALGACLLLVALVTVAASVTKAGRRGKRSSGNLDHLEHRLTLPPGFVATQYLPKVPCSKFFSVQLDSSQGLAV